MIRSVVALIRGEVRGAALERTAQEDASGLGNMYSVPSPPPTVKVVQSIVGRHEDQLSADRNELGVPEQGSGAKAGAIEDDRLVE
jgi:hypothetical protein